MEASEWNEFHAGFLRRLGGSTFLWSRRRQWTLRVVGDVGAVPLVQGKGDYKLDVLLFNETWKRVKRERQGKVEFHLQNSVFFFSSNISNNASRMRGRRASTFL
jgi:hypothetical protein